LSFLVFRSNGLDEENDIERTRLVEFLIKEGVDVNAAMLSLLALCGIRPS
jgi:hypothetical protein